MVYIVVETGEKKRITSNTHYKQRYIDRERLDDLIVSVTSLSTYANYIMVQVFLELDGNLDRKRGQFEIIASLPEMLVGVGDLPVFPDLLGDPRCVRCSF